MAKADNRILNVRSIGGYSHHDYLKLNRGAKKLTEDQFDAVVLRYVEHNTIETVAHLLNLGWDRADELIYDALEVLRAEWDPEDICIPDAAIKEDFPPCLLAAVGVR